MDGALEVLSRKFPSKLSLKSLLLLLLHVYLNNWCTANGAQRVCSADEFHFNYG
jgi:hypothetical protein